MNKNTEYELLTKELYETLLNEDGVTIDVKHNVKIQGKGAKHQIDVYWEYKLAGVTHKVAIECKNYNKKVSIGKVRDFHAVLSDIGNINGIMVSKVGFQKGAKEFAEKYGINLKELRKPNENDWKGKVKGIIAHINLVTIKVKSFEINVDNDWVQQNVTLPKKGELTYTFGGMKDETWIVDSDGKRLNSFFELEENLPQNWKAEESKTYRYDFDNGFLNIVDIGLVKLKSIDYVYDVLVGTPVKLKIDGTESAKAIIKDAISGEISFFNKDGKVKH